MRVLRCCYFLLMAGVSQFSQAALGVNGGFIHVEEEAAAWLEAGGPVTLDLFVNDQVAARLASIPLDGMPILIGPAEQPAGRRGLAPWFRVCPGLTIAGCGRWPACTIIWSWRFFRTRETPQHWVRSGQRIRLCWTLSCRCQTLRQAAPQPVDGNLATNNLRKPIHRSTDLDYLAFPLHHE